MEKRNLLERGNQLEMLDEFDELLEMGELVDWERFRPVLEEVFGTRTGGPGRPSRDPMVMFRAILLGVMNSLSDRRLQFLLLDRTTFKRFVGLESLDQVPDRKTLWKYRNQLAEAGVVEELFDLFKEQLLEHGREFKSGTLVDSSMVDVPRQRNSREENAEVKEGRVPKDWEGNVNRLRQKDVDARWTKKNGVSYYGCKNHVSVDRETKLIDAWLTTAASVHDSRMLRSLLPAFPSGGPRVWADSAYRSEEMVKWLRGRGFRPRICFKGNRGKSLTSRQVRLNRAYSRKHCRVEHVFGSMHTEMPEMVMRCIGRVRANAWIGLRNLCYNMKRFGTLERQAVS